MISSAKFHETLSKLQYCKHIIPLQSYTHNKCHQPWPNFEFHTDYNHVINIHITNVNNTDKIIDHNYQHYHNDQMKSTTATSYIIIKHLNKMFMSKANNNQMKCKNKPACCK